MNIISYLVLPFQKQQVPLRLIRSIGSALFVVLLTVT